MAVSNNSSTTETSSFDSNNSYDVRFKTPFTCVVAGESGSGKTYLVNEILKRKDKIFTKKPDKTILFYTVNQPIYDDMLSSGAIDQLIEGSPSIDQMIEMAEPFKKTNGCCLVFDDHIHNIQSTMSKLFTMYSHHMNISVFFLTQNLFLQDKDYRLMSINTNYMILMGGNRNRGQIQHFARQISPYRTGYIVDGFYDATKNKKYSYLLIDFKQGVPDHIRVRTNIVPQDNIDEPIIIYLEKSI